MKHLIGASMTHVRRRADDAPMPHAKSTAGDSSASGGGGSQRQPRRRYLGAVLMLGLIASSLVWNVTAMLRSLAD
tara:strand:- start:536 stop:760 length:225 start_codon:yes stop_codon:yes gene_type:complete